MRPSRRRVRYSELTSLLDVLFILVFASLIHAADLVDKAKQARKRPAKSIKPKKPKPQPKPKLSPDAGVAKPRPDHAKLRRRALAELRQAMQKRTPVYVRVSREGVVTAVERGEGASALRKPLDTPLLQKVDDPDIGVVYLGDRRDDRRVCSLVRVELGLPDLREHLVIVATDVPLSQLQVALVEGLRRDQDRCLTQERGVGVLLPPQSESPTP